jgi:hypothetical protein
MKLKDIKIRCIFDAFPGLVQHWELFKTLSINPQYIEAQSMYVAIAVPNFLISLNLIGTYAQNI